MNGAKAQNTSKRASDVSLTQRCIAGERGAQRELFAQERNTVHRVLFRILGSNADVEDLAQDVFIQIFRSLHTYRGDAALSTWVGRITTRVCFAYIKKRPPRSVGLDGIANAESREPSPAAKLATERAVRELYDILERIKPKYRVAYALHVIDGRPLSEVATMTGTTVVATKSRVWRARREVESRASKRPSLAAYLASQEGER